MDTLKSVLVSVLILTGFCTAQKIGDKAPVFEAKTLNGKTVKLGDYKGKVVILDFWASWCVPCREALPAMAEIYKKINSPSLSLLAVNIDTDSKNAEKFLKAIKLKPSFTVILDSQSKLPPKYDLQGMPTAVLIDAKGVIRYKHAGFEKSHAVKLEKELKELLSEASGGAQ